MCATTCCVRPSASNCRSSMGRCRARRSISRPRCRSQLRRRSRRAPISTSSWECADSRDLAQISVSSRNSRKPAPAGGRAANAALRPNVRRGSRGKAGHAEARARPTASVDAFPGPEPEVTEPDARSCAPLKRRKQIRAGRRRKRSRRCSRAAGPKLRACPCQVSKLKRVGCLDDGRERRIRRAGARGAAASLRNSLRSTSAPGDEISGDTLSLIRRFDRRVCPLNCRGDEKSGRRPLCARRVSGRADRREGRCVADPNKQAAPAPERPAAGGSKCFTFNNRRFCE